MKPNSTIMKKLMFLASTVLLTLSCSSSSDDNSSNNNSAKITPPTWIQGTWAEEGIYDDTGSVFGFKFVANDFCTVSPGLENCYAYLLTSSQGQVQIEQFISDKEYKATIKTAGQSNTLFHLVKINSNEIKDISIINNELSPVYIKVN